MAISRSYNKHNDTYYVYDTQYVWSEEKHKKIPKRTCIGKWDKESNQIIPTGSEGRLHREVYINPKNTVDASQEDRKVKTDTDVATMFSAVASNLKDINILLSELATSFESIGKRLGENDPLHKV